MEDYFKAINLYKNLETVSEFEKIIICGMGGSAIAGDYVKQLVGNRIIEVVRDGILPKYVDNKTLVICISYSGNTWETISCFNQALEKTKNVIVITSNGTLKELASKNNIKIVTLPEGFQPRFAFPYIFIALISLLDKSILNKIKNTLDNIQIDNDLLKSLASDIKDKEVVIYASNRYYPVAYRFKTQLNENSKIFCKIETFPELNHNEIESLYYTFPNKIFFLIYGKNESEKILKGIEFVKELLTKKKNNVVVISGEEDYIKNLIEFTVFFDKLSLEIAKLRNINPYNIENIRKLKEYISK